MLTTVRDHLATAGPGRRLALAALASVLVLLAMVAGSAVVIRSSGHGPTRNGTAASAEPAGEATTGPASPGTGGQAAVTADLAELTAMTSVTARSSGAYAPVSPTERGQPDLYAAAFVRELLTREYSRSDREDLLAWVQSESAASTEPLVVGLVPAALRSRLAVWSATSSADGDPAPIPSAAEWAGWRQRQATSQVQIVRVTEPVAWAAAVTNQKLTDPGIAARDVQATVITKWRDGAGTRTSTASVTVSLNLEGPPSQAGYGVVDIAGYAAVAVS
jgi:hypothetical protein